MKKYLLLIFSLIIVSCYVLPQKNKLYQSYSSLDLGVIGIHQKSVRKTDFEVVAIPKYKEKIKLRVVQKSFDKQNFKSYSTYIKSTSAKSIITYNDSIKVIPNYVEVTIADKVAVVSALNNNNSTIIDYLFKTPELSLVHKLKFVANSKLLSQIKKSDAFYLKTLDNKQQFILMYKDKELIYKINTASLQVYQYDISSFCWEASERKQLKIVSIVADGENCKNGTVRNPKKEIEKKVKKFEF